MVKSTEDRKKEKEEYRAVRPTKTCRKYWPPSNPRIPDLQHKYGNVRWRSPLSNSRRRTPWKMQPSGSPTSPNFKWKGRTYNIKISNCNSVIRLRRRFNRHILMIVWVSWIMSILPPTATVYLWIRIVLLWMTIIWANIPIFWDPHSHHHYQQKLPQKKEKRPRLTSGRIHWIHWMSLRTLWCWDWRMIMSIVRE